MPPRREPTWSTSLLLRWLIYLPLMVGLVLVALGVLDALNGRRSLLEGWTDGEAMLLVAALASAVSAAWVLARHWQRRGNHPPPGGPASPGRE